MPAGDPGRLEQLADALDHQASAVTDVAGSTRAATGQVRSAADWTGPAAAAYSQFTSEFSSGIGRTAPPLTQIAAAVREYASALRNAQDTATAAGSSCQVAGSQAAARVKAAATALSGVFAGSSGKLRDVAEKAHAVLDASGIDTIVWSLGRRAELAEEFMKELPEQELEWMDQKLPWGQEADEAAWASAVRGWWTESDAAEALGEKFLADVAPGAFWSRAIRLAGGPLDIGGDALTLADPSQSGHMGGVDRDVAALNTELVTADAAGALGEMLSADALSCLGLGPVGVGITVASGFYLAGSYAYEHFAWFRDDIAHPVGQFFVWEARGTATDASDIYHGVVHYGDDVLHWLGL
jgi:uncharacterized protein YukE